MKKKYLFMTMIFSILCFCLFRTSYAKAEMYPETEDETYALNVTVKRNYDYAKEVLAIVNEEREKNGSPTVSLDYELTEAAMLRAAELSYNYSHGRPNHIRLIKIPVFENIALMENSPEQVMHDWMNSEGHRANILEPAWTSVGIGCAKYKDTYCWVQLFSQKTASDPVENGIVEVKEKIDVSTDYLDLHTDNFPTKLSVGKSKQFILCQTNCGWQYLTFYPDADSFDYVSSDESIATVDRNGYVYAKSSGTVTISAYYANTSTIACSQTISCVESSEDDDSTPDTERTSLSSCCVVSVSQYYHTYTGKAIKPKIYVNNGMTYLKQGKDFTVSYVDNIKPGTARAIITGKGKYYGTMTAHFEIKPATYKVTFYKKNGKQNTIRYVKMNTTVKPIKKPTKKGYIFKGWYTKKGKKYNFSSKITKNIGLYAKWKRK